uniref:Uncharacterized protein n=1 Tax=Anguilla anguilla TaxID=7936 RepID=A0A0E9S343_ANGAN
MIFCGFSVAVLSHRNCAAKSCRHPMSCADLFGLHCVVNPALCKGMSPVFHLFTALSIFLQPVLHCYRCCEDI